MHIEMSCLTRLDSDVWGEYCDVTVALLSAVIRGLLESTDSRYSQWLPTPSPPPHLLLLRRRWPRRLALRVYSNISNLAVMK